MAYEAIANLSDPVEAEPILRELRRRKGAHRVIVKKYRPRRSDRQNRWYWPCFVKPFGEFMRDQGEWVTDQDAHEMLKFQFLRRSRTDRRTGEVIEYVPSTTTLDTAEFNEYLDRCAAWLAQTFGFIVPDPADYHEREGADHAK